MKYIKYYIKYDIAKLIKNQSNKKLRSHIQRTTSVRSDITLEDTWRSYVKYDTGKSH